MKTTRFFLCILSIIVIVSPSLFSYPPAVGILGKSKSCMNCHVNNGPWQDDAKMIIDILDKETMKSLRQIDGSFLLEINRGQQKTVLTIIGRAKNDTAPLPRRNAWLYIDPTKIETNALSKFPSGWDVNLPMSCRLVGDKISGFEEASITVLPMTVQPLAEAKDSELQLQVMLTRGEAIKGNGKEGLIGNYFERKVKLKVYD